VDWTVPGQQPQSGIIENPSGDAPSQQKANQSEQYNGFSKIQSYVLTVAGYFKPVLGPTVDRQTFHDVHNVAPILAGVQADIFSTPLGAVHGDVSWAVPRTATAGTDQYTVHAKRWSGGLDIGLGIANVPSLFAEISGGQITRSADPQVRTSQVFDHFYGKDATFGYGVGYTFHSEGKISLRTFIGDLYVPGTNDHSFRVSLSPQFRITREK
jgi:hypothetical protein